MMGFIVYRKQTKDKTRMITPVNPSVREARKPIFFRLTAYIFSIFEKKAILAKSIKNTETNIISWVLVMLLLKQKIFFKLYQQVGLVGGYEEQGARVIWI